MTLSLAELLALHDAHPGDNTLPRNLGDGYLYNHSLIFRNIRDGSLALGCHFNDTPAPLWHMHNVVALLSLPHILAERTVPYIDNVTPLRAVLAARPNLVLPEVYYTGFNGFRGNTLLHETAHCLANAVMPFHAYDRSWDIAMVHREACTILLAESFANAVEFWFSTEIQGEGPEIFLSMNSNARVAPQRGMVLRNLENLAGFSPAFLFVLLCYLHANVHYNARRADPAWIQAVAATAYPNHPGLPTQHLDTLALICRFTFNLSSTFRRTTATIYFDYLGYEGTLAALLDFDPLAIIAANPAMAANTATLVDLAGRGATALSTA